MTFPIEKVRADFPVLTREVNGLPLAYLDSAANQSTPPCSFRNDGPFNTIRYER